MSGEGRFSLSAQEWTPHRRTTETTKDGWRTPKHIYSSLRGRFGFSGDACASTENALEDMFFTEKSDAIISNWSALGDSVFLNPPYSMTAQFVARARRAVEDGETGRCVALIPSTPDVAWFHRDVLSVAAEIWFYRGRLSFRCPDTGKTISGNPVGSCVVVWALGTPIWSGPRFGSLCSKSGQPITDRDRLYWDTRSHDQVGQLSWV